MYADCPERIASTSESIRGYMRTGENDDAKGLIASTELMFYPAGY